MNRKVLSLFMSLIFVFQAPTTIHAKRINKNEDVGKSTSQEVEENSFFSKVKNNIGDIAISSFLVLDVVLLYKMFHQPKTDQQQPTTGTNAPIPQYPDEELLIVPDVSGIINESPVRGLTNFGVSCFINAVIQQLYRIDTFRKMILSQPNVENTSCLVNPGTRPFSWALCMIFLHIGGIIILSNYQLRECVDILGYRGNQEDAAEFMRRIIRKCSDELHQPQDIIDISNPLPLTAGRKNLIDELKEHADIDNVALRAQIAHDYPRMSEALQSLLTRTILNYPTDNTPWLPPILTNEKDIIIPINRTLQNIFVPSGTSANGFSVNRNGSRINIPFRIKLSKDFNIQNDDREFTLSCVTVHLGYSGEFGHYITYRKGDDGKWYCINDNNVSKVPYTLVKVMAESSGTILTYSLSDNNEKDPEEDERLVQSLRKFITQTVQSSGKSKLEIIQLINSINLILDNQILGDKILDLILQSRKNSSELTTLINHL